MSFNDMHPSIVAIAVISLIAGCSRSSDPAPSASTFTLETGVKVTRVSDCEKVDYQPQMSLKKVGENYKVSVVTPLQCNAELAPPFLTEQSGHRATLVLGRVKRGDSNSGCECPRSIDLNIEGRLQGGDTLYVLNDYQVLGHFPVP